MNRKQFLLIILALLVLGGVGAAIFWRDLDAYRESGAKIGAKLMPGLKLADVAQVELRDAKNKATLVRKENFWVVQERENYPADFKAISDLIIKLSDLKVVQADTVGESLLPRVELVEPAEGKNAEGTGTLVNIKDAAGKTLAALVLGKKVLKKDPGNPLPAAADGVPAGRYIRVLGGSDQVVVVSDPLANAEALPGRWLDKDFAKIDRVKTLSVANDSGGWKITRDVEWGQWKFAGGGGELDASAAVGAVNALGQLTFNDVAVGSGATNDGKPMTVVAETFDNLTYTLTLAKAKTGDEFLLKVAVAGDPPRTREIDKGDRAEKAEDKERRDKEFAESRKRLELRMLRDKARSDWTYVVEAKQVAPLMKSRSDMVAQRKPQADPRRPPQ
jgi:hypothetical protein